MSRITFDVPSEFHKTIKTYATLSDKTIKDYIIEKLKDGILEDANSLKESIPNQETLEAFKETENGEVEEFNNSRELFTALDKIEKDAKDSLN